MTLPIDASVALQIVDADPQLVCHIDTIPNEILDRHTFRYYTFMHQFLVFRVVCKRWMRICESTTMAPKQLLITTKRYFDLGRAILLVKKYQPTILHFEVFYGETMSSFTIGRLVEASRSIDTLILRRYDLEEGLIHHNPSLSQIKTLVLMQCPPGLKKIAVFPNLKRLQVQGDIEDKLNVEELTIIHEGNVMVQTGEYLKHTNVPKLTIVTSKKVMQKTFDGTIQELEIDNMPYEQYFRYFGYTKLHSLITRKKFEQAANLLDTVTSEEYEKYLYDSTPANYVYPTNLSMPATD
jgi:hypothetical protein